MTRFFYLKLAITNLRKNKDSYYPYLLTCVISVSLFYIINFLAYNNGLSNFSSGSTNLKTMMNIGAVIMSIFSVIFLFYTNSFLMKQRKKELGLYTILGLTKKNLSFVLFLESLITTVISLILGLILGVIFSKLIYMFVLQIVKVETAVIFEISHVAIINTVFLFILIFVLSLIYNLSQVQLTNPINLLHGGQHGDKEPKANYLFGILGFLLLILGYYLANTVTNIFNAIFVFFFTVILVIVATYIIFTSGSIMVLKRLKRNRNFYYKPSNFVSVSGLIYRMKQNAVGLANICILSTMVILTVATTSSLYFGIGDVVSKEHPFDVSIKYNADSALQQEYDKVMDQELESMNVHSFSNYKFARLYMNVDNGSFTVYSGMSNPEVNPLFRVMSVAEYNTLTKGNYSLSENEVLLFDSSSNHNNSNSISINDNKYNIKEYIDDSTITQFGTTDSYYLVVADIDIVYSLLDSIETDDSNYKSDETDLLRVYMINFENDNQEILDFTESLNKNTYDLSQRVFNISSYPGLLAEVYELYGGFLFIGLFLGLVFMVAAILIIYYKQISEGLQDNNRFVILRKVGMSNKEVKSTIRKQILMVFFLPLLVAVIHTLFAFKLMRQILSSFYLSNVNVFIIAITITIAVFGTIYGIVYSITAKKYYKLVNSST